MEDICRDQLVNRMADRVCCGSAGVWVFVVIGFVLIAWLLLKRSALGQAILAAVGHVLHPAHSRLARLAADLDCRVIAAADRHVGSAGCPPHLPEQRLATQHCSSSTRQPSGSTSAIFGVLATVNVILVLFSFWVGQAQIIHWRLWLNQRMVGDWLGGTAYHRMKFVRDPVDNPDQRIQQDITSYADDSQSLALGAVSSSVSLVSFTIILWSLSGPLTVFGLQIPRAMVFLAFIYVIIATVLAFRIGRPLIRLNFLNELLTASYRYNLVRIRDNSENIAFYRGEQVENTGLMGRFVAVIANTWAIVYRSLKFQGFNLVISQIAVIFPVSHPGAAILQSADHPWRRHPDRAGLRTG